MIEKCVCVQRCACWRVLTSAEGIFKQMCRLFTSCFNKTRACFLIRFCFKWLICLQLQLIPLRSISLSHSIDSISATRQYKCASLHTGAFGIRGWCRKPCLLNCDDLDKCFLTLCCPESISHSDSSQVTTVVSCRWDRVVNEGTPPRVAQWAAG